MSNLLISKISSVGPDAAWNYLLDPLNSLGKEKKKPIFFKRKKLKIFGPPNSETLALLKNLSIKRKPTFWNILIDAIEEERRKVFVSNFRLNIESTYDFIPPEKEIDTKDLSDYI